MSQPTPNTLIHARPRPAGPSGTGIFADQALEAGDLVLREDRPLVCVPDSPKLGETCAWCFLHVGKDVASVKEEVDGRKERRGVQEMLREERKGRLRRCGGCEVLRFCGEDCQKQSWKHSHKYECKIYERLFPNVLPNTVRTILQLLLRRGKGVLADNDWDAFIRLQHHLDDFKAVDTSAGKEQWQNIHMMARAAKEYSGSREDLGLVESMMGRLLINTLTHVTPTYDPLGLAISPTAALFNHSCNPNAVVSFSNAALLVRTLKPVPGDTEITISYIDITNSTPERQFELSARYFFNCTCPECAGSLTLGRPDIPPALLKDFKDEKDLQRFDERMQKYLHDSRYGEDVAKFGWSARLNHLWQAMRRFEYRGDYPVYRQPYARVRAELVLSLMESKRWLEALVHSLIIYFYIDPVLFEQAFHPVRVTHKWVLYRLVKQCGALETEGNSSLKKLRGWLALDWLVVGVGLFTEVEANVGKSHGLQGAFANDVRDERKIMETEMRSVGTEFKAANADIVREWTKLRRMADEGIEWWREEGRKARTLRDPHWQMNAEDPEDAAHSYMEDMHDYQWK